jgi:hypothetical protein
MVRSLGSRFFALADMKLYKMPLYGTHCYVLEPLTTLIKLYFNERTDRKLLKEKGDHCRNLAFPGMA